MKMMNEAILRRTGMEILIDKLGNVEAERFISLVIKEPFDYTVWQRNLYSRMTTDEIFDRAEEFERANEL
jgi:hypothetical protein